MTEQYIQKKVDSIVTQYHSTNPFKLCELMGIKVEKEFLGELKGYYHYFNRIKQIRVNDTLNDYEQKQVCAHELGHAVLHPHTNAIFLCANTYFVTNKFENEANLFSEFLMTLDKDIHIC